MFDCESGSLHQMMMNIARVEIETSQIKLPTTAKFKIHLFVNMVNFLSYSLFTNKVVK